MRFKRRRSERSAPARNVLGSGLETLERRELLTTHPTGIGSVYGMYNTSDLAVYNPITHLPEYYSVQSSLAHNPSTQNPNLINEGKILSGKDRQGDEWTITVHGPGTAIVTDITPNDGSLDDQIDTIQLINTDINKTYVTGTVVGSARVVNPSGTMPFNRLIDSNGVNSVILNGFSLSQTVVPTSGPNNLNTGIYLTGGVRTLKFNSIYAPIDTSTSDSPVNVVIGDASTPLTVQPRITLNSIFNTVFDSTTGSTVPANVPQTNPSVNIIVNGQIKSLDFLSTTANTVNPADQFLFPTVATTGRTSVQAIGIDKLNVAGAATNFTASRSSVPFQNGFSGLSKLKSAHFHGPTDAVGLDVNGNIGSLKFDKGISNPTNLFLGTTAAGTQVPASQYGTPADQTSYAGAGFVGGQITAKKIGSIRIFPSNTVNQVPINPDFVQLYRQGNTAFFARNGNATTNTLITSSGDIGHTVIVGTNQNSEIKSGFHYGSFAAGLEGTRAKSKIAPYHQNGDQLNSVTSATYRPYLNRYGTPRDVRGPGTLKGTTNGVPTTTGAITPLGNVGSGYYARKKVGYFPPPTNPTRINGNLV